MCGTLYDIYNVQYTIFNIINLITYIKHYSHFNYIHILYRVCGNVSVGLVYIQYTLLSISILICV